MPRSSKDIAKRLRFDYRPRRDTFRRLYVLVGLGLCAAAVGLWLAFARTLGARQYLPGPVSPAHATFGDRCERCHVSFAAAPNSKCLECHAPRVHSPFEVDTPACRDCHVEHRPDGVLAVSDRVCVACHGALRSTREPAAAIAAHIDSFANHPEFAPLRADQRDRTALRFNHQLHLTSKDVREELTCAKCHVVAADGHSMLPITFKAHCQRCHELKVKEAPVPIGDIEAPHDQPRAVRDGLVTALLVLGAQRPKELFAADQQILIPGQPARGPVDESKSIQDFQRKWLARLETELYRPFVDQAPLLENNKYCFLCHVQGAGDGADGLPVIEASKPPARWLARAEFSHRTHDQLTCQTCHAGVEHSTLTSDVNLPNLRLCQQCHADARPQSAGTACTLCHLYHDSSRHPELRDTRQVPRAMERLLGAE